MSEPSHSDAAPRGLGADLRSHTHPAFDGARSSGHVRTPIWRLKLRAHVEQRRRHRALANAGTLVQFVGFPRSGHSLIGALLDAHDEAVVAHELDALGLFRKGVPVRRLPGLLAWNAEGFSAHGRHWNGFSYQVPDTRRVADKRPLVIGDKKGDWVTRWSAGTPDLIDRFRAASPFRCKWILVTRHPLDNVATMSLRQGRRYDRLRIQADSGDGFRRALAQAQADGSVAAEVSDDMVADYRALCTAVALMKARIPAEDWLEIAYEDFVAMPHEALGQLAAFVGLDADPAWLTRASALVNQSARRSRDAIGWHEHQRAALADTIAARDFLQAYEC